MRTRRHEWSLLVVAAVFAAAPAALGGASGGAPTVLSVPGRTNVAPSIAAQSAFVSVSWAARTGDGATDIYAATSRDGGRTFGTPQRVNDVAGDASVSGEQPPRVALVPRDGREPSIVVVWTAKGAAGTRLVSARSDDGGRSFSRPLAVPGSAGAGNRGWEATAVDAQGRVVAIWLDHRELADARAASAPMEHAGHDHTGHGDVDGVARAQKSKLYFARLGDAASQPIAAGVCYCCKTTLATGADGSIYAAWRHVYPGNIRDIAFTMSRDGGRTFSPPARVSEDRWVLDGCPENGPSLAVDRANTVHVVWPTLVDSTAGGEPTLALFYASTRDGRRFTARQQIPSDGVPRHPQVAIDGQGRLAVAWDEQAEGSRRVVLATAALDGRGPVTFARTAVDTSDRAEYPVLAAVNGRVVVAFASGPPAQSVIRISER